MERTDFTETIFEVGNCHEHPLFVITYRVLEYWLFFMVIIINSVNGGFS